jgi:hypothetical protein
MMNFGGGGKIDPSKILHMYLSLPATAITVNLLLPEEDS